jgi:hypothetical protein
MNFVSLNAFGIGIEAQKNKRTKPEKQKNKKNPKRG